MTAASATALTTAERFVRLGGLSLHVRESGDGFPLLLINGIGAHNEMWAPLEQALAGVRLIAYDAPGTGRSSTSMVPHTLDGLARLAATLVDRLGYERVDVLGYSFGGLIAQRLAAREPRRVRRLVLAATTPGWGGVPGSLQTMAHMATPLRYYWRAYHEAVLGDLMGGRARSDPDFVRRQGAVRRHHPPSLLGYAWQLAALMADPGTLRLLGTIPSPTLVVAGDDDPVMPLANALLLAHGLPQARLFVAPGDGHLLLLDRESVALPVIEDFLTSPELDGSRAWREAETVTAPRVEAALAREAVQLHHPLAMASAAFRALCGA